MSDYPYGAPASQGPNQPTEQRPTPPAPGHMGGDAPQSLWIDFGRKAFSFCRAGLIFVFNFHPTNSIDNYFVHTHLTGKGRYRVEFSTDRESFGGLGRISESYEYVTQKMDNGDEGFLFYIPCRSAAVLKRVGDA